MYQRRELIRIINLKIFIEKVTETILKSSLEKIMVQRRGKHDQIFATHSCIQNQDRHIRMRTECPSLAQKCQDDRIEMRI